MTFACFSFQKWFDRIYENRKEILLGIILFILLVSIGLFVMISIEHGLERNKEICDKYSNNYSIDIVKNPYKPESIDCKNIKLIYGANTSLA